MDNHLRQLFGPAGMGLCIKDTHRKVLYQNEVCKEHCGNMEGSPCNKGCMCCYVSNEKNPSRNEGVQLYTDRKCKDQFLDMVIVNDGERLITMLYNVSKKHERELEYFTDKGLSKRELQVVRMVVQGQTNSEIVKALKISKATLKTHLNNIYKKLPAEGRVGFRRRAMKAGV